MFFLTRCSFVQDKRDNQLSLRKMIVSRAFGATSSHNYHILSELLKDYLLKGNSSINVLQPLSLSALRFFVPPQELNRCNKQNIDEISIPIPFLNAFWN